MFKKILFALLLSGIVGQAADPTFANISVSGNVLTSGSTFAGSNMIYVSKATQATDTRTGLNKYDATRPFATLTAAQTASVSGDLIVVQPGTYNEGGLGRDGVNWMFLPGATIAYSADTVNAIFEDVSGGMSFSVFGNGQFVRTGTFAGASQVRSAVLTQVNSGTISIEFDYAERGAATQNSAPTFLQQGGTLSLKGRYATSSNEAGGTVGVYLSAVKTIIEISELRSETYDALMVAAGTVFISNSIINGVSEDSNAIEITGGTLVANLCTITGASDADGVINSYGDGATAYFSLCNISSTLAGATVVGSINGQNETNRITFSGCAISVPVTYGGPAIDSYESGGITLRQCRIENPGGFAILLGNSTTILDGCTIVAATGGSKSIDAPSAVNLKAWNSVSNKPVDADVALQVGTITVSTDVQ